MTITNTTKLSYTNGICRSNTGFRSIVINPKDSKVRPVLAARRSGYMPDRHTIQTGQIGDIIIETYYSRHGKSLSAKIVETPKYEPMLAHYGEQNGKAAFPSSLANFHFFLKAIELNLDEKEVELMYEFLSSGNGRQESYLPAGLGWDGENTLGDKSKRSRVTNFFKGLVGPKTLEKIVNSAMSSYREGLPMDWNRASSMPEEMDAPAHVWDGTVVGIDMRTYWVLMDAKGFPQWIAPEPTSGPWGSNYAYSECGQYDASPLPIPPEITRAIKLTFGAYTRDHHSWGIKWELFKR